MEGPKVDSKTESQFSSSMPYLEDSTSLTPLIDSDTPSAINVSDSHDSVFVSGPSPDMSSSVSSPDTLMPIPRRSTRSTKGNPLECMGISIPLTLWLIWDPISHVHVIIVQANDLLCINPSNP